MYFNFSIHVFLTEYLHRSNVTRSGNSSFRSNGIVQGSNNFFSVLFMLIVNSNFTRGAINTNKRVIYFYMVGCNFFSVQFRWCGEKQYTIKQLKSPFEQIEFHIFRGVLNAFCSLWSNKYKSSEYSLKKIAVCKIYNMMKKYSCSYSKHSSQYHSN